jgi:hypothetical protein
MPQLSIFSALSQVQQAEKQHHIAADDLVALPIVYRDIREGTEYRATTFGEWFREVKRNPDAHGKGCTFSPPDRTDSHMPVVTIVFDPDRGIFLFDYDSYMEAR